MSLCPRNPAAVNHLDPACPLGSRRQMWLLQPPALSETGPMLLRSLLRPAVVCLALAAAPVAAFDMTALTEPERAAFQAEVRAYLLANPEVLIEAIAVLEERQAQESIANDAYLAQTHAAEINDDGYSWVGGNPDGDITLVEFMDYRCSFCRRAFAEIEELIATDGNIRFVVKEFPILGEQSLLSAQFAIAIHQLHGDAAYKLAHDALVVMDSDATPDTLARLAETLGLDPLPILDRMVGPEVATVIARNAELANLLQISGTPTFVVGDQMLRGYVPLPQLEQIVAQARID